MYQRQITRHSPSLSRSMPAAATAGPTATATISTSKLLTPSASRLKDVLLLLSLLIILHLLFRPSPRPSSLTTPFDLPLLTRTPTARRHLLFSIASSSSSFPNRKPYISLWYNPNTTRAYAFLDKPTSLDPTSNSLPPVIISQDTSQFPYTFKGGLRSAIRVARVVKEAVELKEDDVRWYVFGDDDTVFFVENLVRILGKYDHEKWYYVGSNSESYEQNVKHSFDMGFGGGGFVISSSLAKVLARVLDSCLVRYAHLYGSDARIFSCLSELGVSLTHEPGFHQVDLRGNLFGLLSAHPLSPLISLHHLDAADEIFPNMSRIEAIKHLFKTTDIDSARILQQVVCYDRANSLTVSISWGYAIQVFERNELLPDLLSVQRTFSPWRRSARIDNSHFMFNLREYPRDPCKRPLVFFMESVASSGTGIWSNYTRHNMKDCSRSNAVKSLMRIRVGSKKLQLNSEQMRAPRRECCEIDRQDEAMDIRIRQCGIDELISMHP